MTALMMQGETIRDYRRQIATCPQASTTLTCPWLSTITAQDEVDVQKELQLYARFAAPPATQQKNATAREAHNARQQHVLDSLDRAQHGLIKLKVNPQRKADTAQLALITTREQYIKATQGWIDTLLTDALTVEYQGNRISIMNHWRTKDWVYLSYA